MKGGETDTRRIEEDEFSGGKLLNEVMCCVCCRAASKGYSYY